MHTESGATLHNSAIESLFGALGETIAKSPEFAERVAAEMLKAKEREKERLPEMIRVKEARKILAAFGKPPIAHVTFMKVYIQSGVLELLDVEETGNHRSFFVSGRKVEALLLDRAKNAKK